MIILIAFSNGAGVCLGYPTTYQPEGQKLTHLIKNQRQNKEEDGHDSIEIILQALQICDGCDTQIQASSSFPLSKSGGGISSVASYLFLFILFHLPTYLSLVPVLKKKEKKNKPTFLSQWKYIFSLLTQKKGVNLSMKISEEKTAIFCQESAQGIFSESKIKIWGSHEQLKLMVDKKIFLKL